MHLRFFPRYCICESRTVSLLLDKRQALIRSIPVCSPGDVIHAFNGTSIESVAQLQLVAAQLKAGDAAVIRIERQGQFQYLALEME
jgi:S1-C subfamily serine protease